MLTLVPHLLLRTNAEKSEAAVTLRDGSYLVSRFAADSSMAALASYDHVDAIVVELPLFAAIGFANAAITAGAQVPILILSSTPEIIRRAVSRAITVVEPGDVVTGVDLMLARFSGCEIFSSNSQSNAHYGAAIRSGAGRQLSAIA